MSQNSQAALNADGTLKDASEITFYHSESDEHPISVNATTSLSAASANGRSDAAVDVSSDDLPDNLTLGSKGKKKANFVAGSRRPVRTTKPSLKVREGGLHSFFSKTVKGPSLAGAAGTSVSTSSSPS